jgi:glutamate formiminotransferase/formiminotetrahydrofolate cyclodeaminase
MELGYECFALANAMAATGNPNSVSDAGVGALCARTAVKGAYLNVRINAQGMEENPEVKHMLARAEELNKATDTAEQEVWDIVMGKIK